MRWPWERRSDPGLPAELVSLVDELRHQNDEACQVVEELRAQIMQVTGGQDRTRG